MKEKLKVCPFCGNKNVECVDKFPSGEKLSIISVSCSFENEGCGASSGYYKNKKEAVAAWNRRYGEISTQKAALETKKSLLI